MNTKKISNTNTNRNSFKAAAPIRIILILLIAVSLLISAAGAEGFFFRMSDPAEKTTDSSSSLFDGKTGTVNMGHGYGYGDLTGKQPDRVYDRSEEGTTEYVYEKVDENAFEQYGIFLYRKGFEAEELGTNSEDSQAFIVYNQDQDYGFMVVYQWDKQLLTMVFFNEAE